MSIFWILMSVAWCILGILEHRTAKAHSIEFKYDLLAVHKLTYRYWYSATVFGLACALLTSGTIRACAF